MIPSMDKIYRHLGRPGRYHVVVYTLLCLNYFPIVMNHMAMALYGAKVDFYCISAPDVTNGKNASFDYITNASAQNHWNLPGNASTAKNSTSKCSIPYKPENNKTRTGTEADCKKWKYNLISENEATVITEWDLVCDNSSLSSWAITIYFLGVMLGGVIFGSLSDRFGRSLFVHITLFSAIALGIGIAFVKSYILFVLMRFLIGILMQGLHTSSFVLIMELFTPEHRTAVGTIIEIFWAFGIMWLAFLGFLLENWRHVQLAMTAPSLIALAYFWLIPESPRWLVSCKRYKEADKILRRAARFNKMELPQEYQFSKIMATNGVSVDHQVETQNSNKPNYTLFDMFKTPKLRMRSFLLFYIWFVIAACYYGLTFNISNLAGNKYLTLFISGVVELPAYCAAIWILKWFGRKKPLCIYLIIGGIGCIASGLIPDKTGSGTDIRLVSTGLAIASKFGMAGAFSVILLFTAELYPTVIRNVGVGTCSFWARVGGVLAPQILRMRSIGNLSFLPVLIFGGISLLGGFLSLLLPETVDTKLPETIAQAEGLEEIKDSDQSEEQHLMTQKSETNKA